MNWKGYIFMARKIRRIASEDEIIAKATIHLRKTFNPARNQSFKGLTIEVSGFDEPLEYWLVNIRCQHGSGRSVGYMEFYSDGELKECSWAETVAFNIVRENFIVGWKLNAAQVV